MKNQKLIRITTVPLSLDKLLSGQLHFMNSYYEVIAVSSEKEYLERIGSKENVSTFHLEMSRKITPLHDCIAVFRLVLFLRKQKPLIVHTHTPKAGIVGMLAAKIAGVPNRLHTVAGLPLLEAVGLKRKLLDFVEKTTYSLATKVYPNSYGLKDIILQNKFCPPQKLKVIANGSSNGINTDYFNPDLFSTEQKATVSSQLNITETDFVFVFVGRLVKDKGLNELITAFELLQKNHTNAKLLLVGDYESDLDPLLPTTLYTINHNPSIITVGFQQDVRPYLAIAHALVFPSYREGFPNVVMQAGAMGLPSIVSNINGCNEIIEEGINGTIIPVKNADAIFQKMELFVKDINFYQELKKKSRIRITSRYDQLVVWNAILEEYQQLLTP